MKDIVLIAEDESTNKLLIKRVVEDLGLSAIVASSGKLAWEILKDNPDITLLITDMRMPEMNGEELVIKIKADDSLKNIPIIMVSGVVKLSEITEMLDAGADRFLPKPINVEHLKQYIKAIKDARTGPKRKSVNS